MFFRSLSPVVISCVLVSSACSVGSAPVAPAAARAPVATPETAPSFPHDDAKTALVAATRGLKACRGAEPTVVHATLEFEPSGRVSRLEITPSAGRLADCVRADLAQVAIPSFEGPPVAMQMRVRL